MDPEKWSRLREDYHEALDLPPEDLAAMLVRLRRDDPAVAAELESLLATKPPEGFLETPPLVLESALEVRDERLGHYRLVREIGRGGMGVVFEAVREEAGVCQTVAVKVLTASPLDSRSEARFQRERQALAELEHPGIVRLLDWGQTADGHAYLVTEYVAQARPIDTFRAEEKLSPRAIVSLFLEVCGAVAHAHGRLVVHNDLKPGNILVTREGRVKLLDFGIAKLLDAAPAAHMTTVRRLTPAYASPEQLLGKPTGTASDVFSLGAMLCELLCGCLPYGEAAALEGEPRRPSEAPGLPPQQRRALRSDLDRIVLKAVERDPARRYSSVEALAGDLRSHLEGRAVSVRGGGWYLARKFAARNRASVAAAVIAVVSLVAGTGVAVWKARVAETRYRHLRELTHSLVFDVHDSIQRLPGATKARQALVTNALRYLADLEKDAPDDGALMLELAAGYAKIAGIQGEPYQANLGNIAGAVANNEKALALLLRYWQRHRFDPVAGTLMVDVTVSLMSLVRDPAAGIGRADKIVPLVEEWVAARPRQIEALRAEIALKCRESGIRVYLGQFDRALTNASRAEIAARRAIEIVPEDVDSQWRLTDTQGNRGLVSLYSGDLPAALANCDHVIQFRSRLARVAGAHAGIQRDVGIHWGRKSQILIQLGRFPEALAATEREMAIASELAAADPADANARKDLALAHFRRGRVRIAAGQTAAGLADLEWAVNAFATLPDGEFTFPWFYSQARNELVMSLVRFRPDEGLDRAEEAAAKSVPYLDRASAAAPSFVSLICERARARLGLALVKRQRSMRPAVTATQRQALDAGTVELLRRSVADWRLLRERSPQDRTRLDEQRLAEDLLARLTTQGK